MIAKCGPRKRAVETELRLKRLYEAIEAGVADLNDPALKERVVALRTLRDQAQADLERAQAQLENSGSMAVTPAALRTFASAARKRLRLEGGGYRRDHLRAFAQRVEVGESHVRIMGSTGTLLRTLASVSSGKSAGIGVPTIGLKWRSRWDSNPRNHLWLGRFQVGCLRPLDHCSVEFLSASPQAIPDAPAMRSINGVNGHHSLAFRSSWFARAAWAER